MSFALFHTRIPCNIRYNKSDVYVIPEHYANGRLALQLFDAESDEPVAMATTNLPDHACPTTDIYIKDYSENEGMTTFLINAKIIQRKPTHMVHSGFVTIHRYHLTDRAIEELTTLNQLPQPE